jgi:hypothetical protein
MNLDLGTQNTKPTQSPKESPVSSPRFIKSFSSLGLGSPGGEERKRSGSSSSGAITPTKESLSRSQKERKMALMDPNELYKLIEAKTILENKGDSK